MGDSRERQRMLFECPVEVKRATRARAGIDGVNPAEVIISALRSYLGEEIEKAVKRMQKEGEIE